jgi:hypothetical protein
MGHYVGKNVVIMMEKFDNENQKYIVVVDRTTGKRIKITLADVD